MGESPRLRDGRTGWDRRGRRAACDARSPDDDTSQHDRAKRVGSGGRGLSPWLLRLWSWRAPSRRIDVGQRLVINRVDLPCEAEPVPVFVHTSIVYDPSVGRHGAFWLASCMLCS